MNAMGRKPKSNQVRDQQINLRLTYNELALLDWLTENGTTKKQSQADTIVMALKHYHLTRAVKFREDLNF